MKKFVEILRHGIKHGIKYLKYPRRNFRDAALNVLLPDYSSFFIIVIILSATFMAMPMGLSQADERDLAIEATLPAELDLGNSSYLYYDRLFRITNLGKMPGITDSIDATVDYNVSTGETMLHTSQFTLTGINSYKAAGTGNYNFTQPGNYTICGKISNASVFDPNPGNNIACQLTVIAGAHLPSNISLNQSDELNESPINITFNQSINISINETGNVSLNESAGNTTLNASLNVTWTTPNSSVKCNMTLQIKTPKDLFEDEKITFSHEISGKIENYSIVYWIEDLFGNILKEPVATTNTNSKQFTPKPHENDMVIVIKAKLEVACQIFDNNSAIAQKIIIFKSGTYNPPVKGAGCSSKPDCDCGGGQGSVLACQPVLNATRQAKPGKINSFYTRAKTPDEEINLYYNVNPNPDSRLLLYKLELLENISIGTAGQNGNSKGNLTAQLTSGGNVFALMLQKGSNLDDLSMLYFWNQPDTTGNSAGAESGEERLLHKTESNARYEPVSAANAQETAGQKLAAESELPAKMPTGSVVYESGQSKAGKTIPYILGGTAALAASTLVWKKFRPG